MAYSCHFSCNSLIYLSDHGGMDLLFGQTIHQILSVVCYKQKALTRPKTVWVKIKELTYLNNFLGNRDL